MPAIGFEYWPWWAGALALALVAVGHAWFIRAPLGVSGLFTRLVNARSELRVERENAALLADPKSFEAMMMAATASAAGAAGFDAGCAQVATAPAEPVVAAPSPAASSVVASAVFLGCVAAGAAVARLVRGEGFGASVDMGATFTRLFGSGTGMYLALIVGGALVGAGTRMAGGCTSGHGLAGVARLQPASIIATATFFGVGVAVSLLLARWAS